MDHGGSKGEGACGVTCRRLVRWRAACTGACKHGQLWVRWGTEEGQWVSRRDRGPPRYTMRYTYYVTLAATAR